MADIGQTEVALQLIDTKAKIANDFAEFNRINNKQRDTKLSDDELDRLEVLTDENKRGLFDANLKPEAAESLYAEFKAAHPDRDEIEGDPAELAAEYRRLTKLMTEKGRQGMSQEEIDRLNQLEASKDSWLQ